MSTKDHHDLLAMYANLDQDLLAMYANLDQLTSSVRMVDTLPNATASDKHHTLIRLRRTIRNLSDDIAELEAARDRVPALEERVATLSSQLEDTRHQQRRLRRWTQWGVGLVPLYAVMAVVRDIPKGIDSAWFWVPLLGYVLWGIFLIAGRPK